MKKAKVRSDGRYTIKRTVKEIPDKYGNPTVKYFYSSISKADCIRQYEEWLISARQTEETKSHVRFDEFAEQWLKTCKEGRVSDVTYQYTYRNTVVTHLVPFFGRYELANITPNLVNEFYSSKTKCSPSAIHKMQLCLLGIFESAVDNGIINRNPAKNCKPVRGKHPDAKSVYTDDEYRRVIDFITAESGFLDIVLLLECGLRRGELLALEWTDIDLSERTISISKAVTVVDGQSVVSDTKTPSSVRIIPLSDTAYEYMKSVDSAGGLVFPNTSGGVLNVNFWSRKVYARKMQKISETLGVPALNPHELRHTCGTRLWKQSNDLYAVSKFLGHASVSITASIYVHGDAEALRKALFKK